MSDPAILFLKPNAISKYDRGLLRKAGVLVVEIDDPTAVKFTRAAIEIGDGEMLQAASKAIGKSEVAQKAFATAIMAIIDAKAADRP